MTTSTKDHVEDLSLQSASINTQPGVEYSTERRIWQGIPGIERTETGRLFVTWYSGGDTEGPENYILLVTSEDDGSTWSDPVAVVDPPTPVRAFDPVLWRDPDGSLWWFWSQSYGVFDGRAGVWAVRCIDPSASKLTWTAPLRLFDGVMMNKPTVLRNGTWLGCGAIWSHDHAGFVPREEMRSLRFSNVYSSSDQGKTWILLGQADVPDRQFDEHMIVERRDGSLWMLVRTHTGIGEAVSLDGGKTWTASKGNVLEGPCSRFFIRRLHSGRLLLLNHYRFQGRNNLTAALSDDDGKSWYGNLLLDERNEVSYPDGIETPDGVTYIVYDRERTLAKEILLATFTEADVEAGGLVSDQGRLRQLINRGVPV